MKPWWAWLEQRTGWPAAARRWLWDPLPGGPRWRYTWFSLLVAAFLVQAGTGFFLWAHYSPSTTTAWESVNHLQTSIPGGAFLRGLHHFGAQAFVVLLALHILQLVVTRACRAPAELILWTALLLLPLAVGLSVTGWMLPYDQHGFWAARVPLNLVAIAPGVGEPLRLLLLGGADVTHLTLTRFLALHAGLLPLFVLGLLLLHVLLGWRQVRQNLEFGATSEESYWPGQAWRDALVIAAFVGGLVLWVVWHGGAPLGAPANPTEEYSAARPEWFFLWLFQFLKYFRGGTEIWGAMVIPGIVFLLLAVTPWTSRTRLGHRGNLGFAILLVTAALLLSLQAWWEDRSDPVFHAAVRQADREANRVQVLIAAEGGLPSAGAAVLVARDPWLQGPGLFAQHCAGCHRWRGHNGLGAEGAEAPTAPDLFGFGSRTWLAGLLDPQQVDRFTYFGGTAFKQGKMVRFVQRDVAGFDAAQAAQLRRAIVALSAEAGLPQQRSLDDRDAAIIAEGRALLDDPDLRCTECHRFHDRGEDPSGPDLTGYASRSWMLDFVRDPAHERFYGARNDRMPRFGEDQLLDDASLGLIIDWLREDWPSGSKPVGGTASPSR